MTTINDIPLSEYTIEMFPEQIQNTGIFERKEFKFYIPNVPYKDIGQLYIANAGRISSISPDLMIYLLIKYPEYVIIPNTLTPKQLMAYVKYMDDEICPFHYELIKNSIGSILSYSEERDIVLSCDPKYYSLVRKLPLSIRINDIDYDVKIKEIHGKRVIIENHPYGYDGKMKIITYESMLANELKHGNFYNLYINCDIYNITIKKWPEPSAFATWKIGPCCTILSGLFKNCPYEPHIYSWNVSHIIEISDLFKRSAVRDLSMMSFDKCEIGTKAFYYSDIEKLPKFNSLCGINEMCSHCFKLKDIRSLNTELISDMDFAFESTPIKKAFNNRKFTRLISAYKTFEKCPNLKSAFNNCYVNTLYPMATFVKTFYKCPNLKSVFNYCPKLSIDYSKDIFDTEIKAVFRE